MVAPPTQRLTWSPRLSLRRLFLFVAVLACVATIFKLRSDLRIARNELLAIRERGGYLEISDENVIHAVRLPTEDGLQWCFRVYVPGHLEVAVHSHGRLFTRDYPPAKWPKILGPGEHLLTYMLHENSLGNTSINYAMRGPVRTAKGEIHTQHEITWSSSVATRAYYRGINEFNNPTDSDRWRSFHTLQLDESKPFALMRFGPRDKEIQGYQGPGLTIWLEPRKTNP